MALLFSIYRLLRPKMENLAGIHPWLPAVMLLAFLPIGVALIEGQDSLLLLLLFAAALACMEQGRETLAGVLAGLGLFKFQLTIPLALVSSFGATGISLKECGYRRFQQQRSPYG